ncbi:MAG TPA: efflux RND transporter periplasmic adaptor subunit [Acidobacteriota bacterium]|nr:efflux RND transporter periplasmic adaptor subunit [Acidobacteriota bacterium]
MPRPRWYKSKYLWLGFIVLSTVGGLGAWKFFTVKADKPVYLFTTVDKGNIVMQVAATGTLAAVTTVQVGSQVSGNIAELYADFNSEVKKGQLLAKLDPAIFQAQVEQANANVQTAEATLNDDVAAIATTRANLEKAKVDVLDKSRKLKRQKELSDENLISRDDFDTAQAALDAAVATQKSVEAQLESSQAHQKADESRLAQAKANLETAKLNLEHTIITSPISGTIISRSVDRGQTVAASFSSPTLFTIGEDLTKMQVNTNIDEADVGRIKTGMEATFAVDAYPGETFSGMISQVRLAATTVQNVVTYNAIIDVANPQLKLKPGMTCNVKILIEKVEDTVKIPNSALRFKPTMSEPEFVEAFKRAGEEQAWNRFKFMLLGTPGASPSAAGGAAMAGAGGTRGGMGGGGFGGGGNTPRRDPGTMMTRSTRGRRVPVWIMGDDKLLRPVIVRLGLTDGVTTQVEEGKLKQGDRIITGLEVDPNRQAPTATTTRPPGFGGPMGGGPRR